MQPKPQPISERVWQPTTISASRDGDVVELHGYLDGNPPDCLFPGQCCMPGEHLPSECHTAEMVQEYEAEQTEPLRPLTGPQCAGVFVAIATAAGAWLTLYPVGVRVLGWLVD